MDDLGCSPLDWKLGALGCRVLVVKYKPRKTKVGHLDNIVVSNQAVARRLQQAVEMEAQ